MLHWNNFMNLLHLISQHSAPITSAYLHYPYMPSVWTSLQLQWYTQSHGKLFFAHWLWNWIISSFKAWVTEWQWVARMHWHIDMINVQCLGSLDHDPTWIISDDGLFIKLHTCKSIGVESTIQYLRDRDMDEIGLFKTRFGSYTKCCWVCSYITISQYGHLKNTYMCM